LGKTIFTIGETENTVENFTYSLNRTRGAPPGEVNYLSVSLSVMGKNSLDALTIRGGPFNCAISVYDESGALFKRLELEGAEITGCNANMSTQSCYFTSIQLEAGIIRFDGAEARVKTGNE
jgi:hypothetical protein